MFNLTFANLPVYSASAARTALAAINRAAPADLDKANSLMVPRGREPARGWLCMLSSDLDEIDLDAYQQLKFAYQDETGGALQTRTFENMVVCREPVALTGGLDQDNDSSLYLVEISDPRWLCRNPYFSVAINAAYNVRDQSQTATDVTAFLSGSLDSGAFWTWQTMIDDIWALMEDILGDAPTLPFTPDGTPEGWIFQGVAAWDALCDVLDRIGCAIRPDLTQVDNPYTIIRVGNNDAAVETALGTGTIIFDGFYKSITRGIVPFGVRVFFNRREQSDEATFNNPSAWLTSAVHTVDIDGPETDTAEPETYHPIWDDLPAVYDASNTLTNGAALTTRAQERSDDYFRVLESGENRFWRRYSGILAVSPGSILSGVGWRESGGGLLTEVVRLPKAYLSVADDGKWCEHNDALRTQPPDFRPTWPLTKAAKLCARVASTANISISSLPTTINAITMATGDIFLLTAQTAGSEHQQRLWTYTTTGAAAIAAPGADTAADYAHGMVVNVYEGSNHGLWQLNTAPPITPGTTGLTWSKLTAGGITSLNGLTGATQTFAVGASGANFNISSSGTTHTFNLPDAGFASRGAMTTTRQNFLGTKQFNVYADGDDPSTTLMEWVSRLSGSTIADMYLEETEDEYPGTYGVTFRHGANEGVVGVFANSYWRLGYSGGEEDGSDAQIGFVIGGFDGSGDGTSTSPVLPSYGINSTFYAGGSHDTITLLWGKWATVSGLSFSGGLYTGGTLSGGGVGTESSGGID